MFRELLDAGDSRKVSMKLRLLPTLLSAVLLITVSGGQAFAQARGKGVTVIPVVNNTNGKVEGMVVLEPTGKSNDGARWRFGSNTLESAFGLSSGESLALLCGGKGGIPSRMDRLSDDCSLGAISPRGAAASVGGRNARVGVGVSKARESLPGWLAPGSRNRVEQTDLALFAEYNLGRSGVVSIAGTTAKARLMPAAEMPQFASRWNSKGLVIGGGVGAFRASVFGRVVEVPGQPGKWEGFGVGLTWRTPWSGPLSVGAENVVTRGKNPFAPSAAKGEEEGTVPYVRYQQDL